MVVVFPAPFGPRMPVTAPRAALSVSPSTAVVWPYRLTSAPISTAGVCGTVLTDASLRRQQRVQRSGVDDPRSPRGERVVDGRRRIVVVHRAILDDAPGVDNRRRAAHAYSLRLPGLRIHHTRRSLCFP